MISFKNITRSDRGFTVIELLVVLAIIGIFAAIVIAALSQPRRQANVGAFRTETDSILPAAISYCDGRDSSASFSYGAGTTISAGSVDCTDAGAIATTVINDSIDLDCSATLSMSGISIEC